jgi:hypothetical protein
MTTATDYRHHLAELEEERLLAREAGLSDDGAYMAELDEEIAATRAAWIGSAVTEIASLRAWLNGRQQG